MTSEDFAEVLWRDFRRLTVDAMVCEIYETVQGMIDDFFAAHEIDAAAASEIANDVASTLRRKIGLHFCEDIGSYHKVVTMGLYEVTDGASHDRVEYVEARRA